MHAIRQAGCHHVDLFFVGFLDGPFGFALEEAFLQSVGFQALLLAHPIECLVEARRTIDLTAAVNFEATLKPFHHRLSFWGELGGLCLWQVAVCMCACLHVPHRHLLLLLRLLLLLVLLKIEHVLLEDELLLLLGRLLGRLEKIFTVAIFVFH